MKLLISEFDSYLTYPAFRRGSVTDMDVVARACGYLEGSSVAMMVASVRIDEFEYRLEVDFLSCGEQKISDNLPSLEVMSELVDVRPDLIEETLNDARKCKVSSSEKVLILSTLANEIDGLFSCSSWYEGVVTLKRYHPGGEVELLADDYESKLGLDGHHESLHDIVSRFDNDDKLEEYIRFLIRD